MKPAAIVRGWKAELVRRGFEARGAGYYRYVGPIEQAIIVQKSAVFKGKTRVNLALSVRDSSLHPVRFRNVFIGHLRADGAYFRHTEQSWIDAKDLELMFAPLVEYGIPFLETFSDLQLLTSTLESCVAKHVSFGQLFASQDVPNQLWSSELLRQFEDAFHQMKEAESQPGSLSFHLILSLLYSEMGETGIGM